MSQAASFQADVFHGELTANRAQVFVRVPRLPEYDGCTLTGFVHGPRCEYAHTLPAKFTLRDLGPGPTLLARATITDPCLWTSDLPQIYDVHIELRRGGQLVASDQRMFGLRSIGARASAGRGQLIREGKVWIPRGCTVEMPAPDDLLALRDELLVGICQDMPPLDLLAEASRRGLYLIVNLPEQTADVPAALSQLARWPAVMMAVIKGGDNLPREVGMAAPNVLLAQAISSSQLGNIPVADWAAAAVVTIAGNEHVEPAFMAKSKLPLLIVRETAESLPAAAARAACDQLQRDLAAAGQFAGYLVTFPAHVMNPRD